MRKLILIASLFLAQEAIAQQQEHLTQYQFNQFAFNPALAGSKSCIDIRGGYRLQWVGIDGAPETAFLNVHAPLKFGKKKKSAFGPSHGIGANLRRDAIGPFSNIEGQVAYAFHIPIKRSIKLSFGTSFGFKQSAFDDNKFVTIYPDNAIPSAQNFIIFPDAKFGAWLTTKDEYFGFAINNLFGNKLEQLGQNSKLERHFYITAGKKLKLEKGWTLIPSILMLKTKNTPLDFHLSALFDLDNTISFGIGLRRTDAITGQIRVKFMDFISIGYSFDFIISKLQKNMYQSHEVSFALNGCSNYGSTSTIRCATFE
jgi:type IX secretion system PorP/SprF family membrane protein